MQNWKSLAHLLDISDSDIVNIEYSNRGPLSDAVYEMLSIWQTRQGNRASAKVLAEALDAAKMQGVLRKFSSRLFHSQFLNWLDHEQKLIEIECIFFLSDDLNA